MSPAENEAALRDAFSVIHDPHERLSAIVNACAGGGLPEECRRDEDLVPGCVSRVWLTMNAVEGVMRLRWDAASPVVRGLAGLVCRVYDGTRLDEAMSHDTAILEALSLTRQISPTRLHGLVSVARRIRELAAAG